MHDVFVVTSEGSGGGHITRIVHAANEDDARRTHQDSYPGESIVAVATRVTQLTSITKSIESSAVPRHGLGDAARSESWPETSGKERTGRFEGIRPCTG